MTVCRVAQHHLCEDLPLPGPVGVLHGDSEPPERLPGHQGGLPLLWARAAGDQGQCGAQWSAGTHLGGVSQVEEWQTLYTVLNTMYHCCRQCNLQFSSPYSVSVSASNTVGSSPATLYNFTTEHQSLLNLKWSGASRYYTRPSNIAPL